MKATTSYYNSQDGSSSASQKRSSPSTASSSCSMASSSSAAARRRAPSSPTARLARDSSSSAEGSSSSNRKRTSSVNAMEQQQQAAMVLTKEQINRQRALESQMQSLYEVEYRDEVLQYMYEMESQTMASVELIDMQPELAWYMRPYLVDFLIEIHQQYRLRPETLYLAINIVDRYVSKRIVYKKHYQLVGCAALWIASKFEDAKDRVPTVEDLCAVCCSAYDVSAFIQMEGHVLSTIGWCLGHPTAEAWLRAACSEGPQAPMEEQRTQHVARFIMEITLFHRAFVSIKPSDIALSCLLLARYMCESDKLYRVQQKPEVVKIAQMLDAHLAEHLEQVSSTVVKKYSPSFYSRSSSYAREWYLAGRRFNYAPFSTDASASQSVIPEIDMTHSSPTSCSSSSSSTAGDSDEEDMLSSEPITPTTSVCSSSDPYDDGMAAAHVAKFAGNQSKYLSAPTRNQYYGQPPQYSQQPQSAAPTPSAGGMQWQMQVVPPSAEQASYRAAP